MMEQLDPLGTSVTTACSYTPADKGYGIRAAIGQVQSGCKKPAPVLFDRGSGGPGVDAGYVDNGSAFGGKAFPALWASTTRQPALPEGATAMASVL